MCLDKLFRKKPPVVITGNNICLSYNINDYKGTENDLNGCVNDGINAEKFLLTNYPQFKTTRFIDYNVTRALFKSTVKNTIVAGQSGDFIIIHYSGHGSFGVAPGNTEADGYSECLVLYDGPFWDYEFAEILSLVPDGVKVLVILDSCFSFGATSTRLIGKEIHYLKPRFMPIQDLKPDIQKRKSALLDENLKYILLSGCQERQTSADAYIAGAGYVGAFTYFLLMKAWDRLFNYNQWTDETIYRLNKASFEQVPGIRGSSSLINQVILT